MARAACAHVHNPTMPAAGSVRCAWRQRERRRPPPGRATGCTGCNADGGLVPLKTPHPSRQCGQAQVWGLVCLAYAWITRGSTTPPARVPACALPISCRHPPPNLPARPKAGPRRARLARPARAPLHLGQTPALSPTPTCMCASVVASVCRVAPRHALTPSAACSVLLPY